MATIVGGKGEWMLACHDSSLKMSRVEIGRPAPGADDVKIKLVYCGMCHSDLHTVDGGWGVNKYPIAVGHELAGVVTEVGANAAGKFKVGQNVAVGCMVNSCMTCGLCETGLEQHCPTMAQTYSSPWPEGCGHDDCAGTHTNGGYSTGITVHQRFCFSVPEGMPLEHAGPLCCAGITTYSPLARYVKGKTNQAVGVVGFGGLGHMAVKIAVAMGAKVTVFSRSEAKKADAEALGASLAVYTDAAAMTALFRTFDLIVDTVAAPHEINGLISTLKPFTGIISMIGGVPEPYKVAGFPMIFNGTRLEGSLIGGCALTQEMLDFCAASKIAPEVKIIPASEAEGVFQGMQKGEGGPIRNVIDISTLMDVPEYAPGAAAEAKA